MKGGSSESSSSQSLIYVMLGIKLILAKGGKPKNGEMKKRSERGRLRIRGNGLNRRRHAPARSPTSAKG